MSKVRIDMETKIHYTAVIPPEVYKKVLEANGDSLEGLKEAILQQFQKLFEEEINVENNETHVLPETATFVVEQVCDD